MSSSKTKDSYGPKNADWPPADVANELHGKLKKNGMHYGPFFNRQINPNNLCICAMHYVCEHTSCDYLLANHVNPDSRIKEPESC